MMKKILSIVLAICLLSISGQTFAQDSRQRSTQTIIQDVLALVPIQDKKTFDSEMGDVAKAAPASVELLCLMLQSAEMHANNKVEYALSGVVNYVSEHPEYKTPVLEALKSCIPRAADATARQFVSSLVDQIDPAYKAPEYKQHAGVQPYAAQWEALNKGGQEAEKALLRSIKSQDHALRMQALKFATDHGMATDELAAKVMKQYAKAPAMGKVDILNWLGDNKVQSQQAALIAAAKGTDEKAQAAIEALGKLSTQEAAATLLSLLGKTNSDAAFRALCSYPMNISGRVNEALKTAKGTRQDALVKLAYARRIHACGPQVIALAPTSEVALKALPGVVIKQDAPAVARLLESCSASQQGTYQKALAACFQFETAKDQYAAISQLMNQSQKPECFYSVLAATGTDESVAELEKLYASTQSDKVLAAIKASSNYRATKTLLAAAKKGDESCLSRYVQLVTAQEADIDSRQSKLAEALKLTKNQGTQKTILAALGGIPTLPAFTTVSRYVEDKALGYEASMAAKNIASKAAEDIDYKQLKNVLTKASDRIKAHGTADDGYAVDEIKKILADAVPAPVCVLSPEEAKEGFELLFDGTNLDKWQGDIGEYTPVNGCISVTANYGNEGNLYTKKQYKDFVFRFEFCFVRPGINNGVGIRTPMHVDAAYDAMCECQILDHDDPIYAGLRDYQVHGSVYGIIPAKRIKHKPLGEWSTEEIRVKGNHITVTVNGEVIVDGDVKEACQGHNVAPDGSQTNPYTVDHRNHPGMFNKKGYISFCGHGAGLKLRNIRVKEL